MDNTSAGDKKLSLPDGFIPYDLLVNENTGSAPAPVLVALSGGADSRALFDLTAKYFKEKNGFFFACHVNHGIRGEEAIRDRDFCIALADACPQCKSIFVLNADVPALAKASGRSVELEARLLRYDFFERVMRENGIPYLATAHNADDNLETLIFNLTRGSGARGMCGIPPTRPLSFGTVLRPILRMTKSDVLEYCRKEQLEFVTDSTNLCTDYSRNLIRAKIVPLLESLNPDVRGSAMRLSDNMRALCSYAEDSARKICSDNDGSGSAFDGMLGGGTDIRAVASASDALLPFIFSNAVSDSASEISLEAVHISALKELCLKGRDGSSISLPGGYRGRICGDRLVFERDNEDGNASYDIPLSEGENILPCKMSLHVLTPGDDSVTPAPEKMLPEALKVCISSKELAPPLCARTRLQGDRILCSGMHKSVKKLMCDKKIPLWLRDKLPIVYDKKGILWIPGVAVRDNALSKGGGISLFIKY